MAPKPRYTDGEKVLCFHGPLLYEAKCLKSQLRDKHMKYFIHYSGWNKNWDEWVPECRVLKYNDVNLQKQKELARTHMKAKKTKAAKVQVKAKETEKESPPAPSPSISAEKPKPKPEKRQAPSPVPEPEPVSEPPVEPKKKKPKVEACFVEEVEPELEIKLRTDRKVQSWMIDDCDLITRQKKILHLPARITIDHMIASYVKEKVSEKGITPEQETYIIQFSNNIRGCFNTSLGKALLYKFERPQYAEMLTEYSESSMCQIYGAIHLVRLYSRLGKLLEEKTKNLVKKAMVNLMVHLEDFMKYLARNDSFFNLDDYIVASPEYHRRAL